MSRLKNLFSLIFMILCTTILCGCAQIDYSRMVYPDGKVSDRIVVEIDEDAFRHCSASKGDLLNLVKVEFENYYVQPIEDFKAEFWASTYDFEDKQLVQDGITTDVRVIGNSIFCDVNFNNTRAFDLYYRNIDKGEEDDSSQTDFREGTFVNKHVQSSENAFAVLKTEFVQSLIGKYRTLFQYKYGLKDLKLTQEYASPDLEVYSNADEIVVEDGMKMHHWVIDPSSLEFELEFYTVTPHTTSWYILALIISFLSIVWVAGAIHRQKQKDGEIK